VYNTEGWLEKNRDVLTPGVTGLLRESSMELVNELFTLSQTATGGLEASEAHATVHRRQVNAKRLISVSTGVPLGDRKGGFPLCYLRAVCQLACLFVCLFACHFSFLLFVSFKYLTHQPRNRPCARRRGNRVPRTKPTPTLRHRRLRWWSCGASQARP
jgi:hypothetical protein